MRPSKYPRWADAGGILVEPTEGKKDIGWLTSEKPPAQYINWDLNLLYQWIVYLDGVAGQQFGDGSDGSAVLNGIVAAPPYASLIGGVYVLQRDGFAQDLTLNNCTLDTNGFRMFVNGILTLTGAAPLVRCDGLPGVLGAAGAGAHRGSLYGGAIGGVGGINNGAGPTVGTNSNTFPKFTGTGGNGGAGAVGDPGGGAAGGSAIAIIPNAGGWKHLSTLHQGYVLGENGGTSTLTGLTGGAGGGGGGADDPGLRDGGGGGGGGGVVALAARQISLLSDATIRAIGGAGGNGGGLHAGGGGGGGGGSLFLTYGSLALNGHVLTRSVAGGAGGTGLVNGSTGIAGAIIEHDLSVGGVPGVVGHEESGVGTMTAAGAGDGVDYLQISFATPFADTSFKFSFSLYNSDGAVQIGAVLINKTTTGMRIVPVVPFNGQISWEAET